ncbi:MAG: hypothetical protein J0H43_11090, partial [Actinobacteria bacterium]|nr:hypothetical protein [Actinomycetota bacterium]
MNDMQLSRRGLLTAAGVAAGGAALLGAARPAGASPVTPNSTHAPDGVPAGLPTPIASAPVPGVSYQFRTFEEFIPESFSAGRAWAPNAGVYPNLAFGLLATGFDLPPGATLYDVEWYAYNGTGSPFSALLRIWTAGTSTFYYGGVDTTIPAGSAVAATRSLVPSASNGPFRHGTRAVACLNLPTGGTAQINGVRIGYRNGPTAPVLLSSPVRVYDSRSHDGALSSGHTRTLDLSSHLPVGAVGAIVNIAVTQTVGSGYLTLYPAG